MPVVLKNSEGGGDFTPHPPGAFLAVCADVYVKEEKNNYFGTKNDSGKIDSRETIQKVYIVFLTEEPIEIKGDLKPRYVSYSGSASLGTAEKPSKTRTFLKTWWPGLTDEKINEGIDMEKMIGQGAYVTVVQKPWRDKVWASVASAMKPPTGSTIPLIPPDFKRHEEREAMKATAGHDDTIAQAHIDDALASEDTDDLPF